MRAWRVGEESERRVRFGGCVGGSCGWVCNEDGRRLMKEVVRR